jgi:processive 1,2-diacylglycerol beta-glucosyltransferase
MPDQGELWQSEVPSWQVSRPPAPLDVLVVGAGFGGGHNQSARAVAEALVKEWPDARTAVLDYLAWFPPGLGQLSARSYTAMTKYWPAAYGLLQDLSGHLAPLPGWTDLIGSVGADPFWAALEAWQPRLLVLTHPLPATVVARWRHQGLTIPPTCVVVTDYSLHPQWAQPGLDRYCVANQSVKAQLEASGIPAERIVLTGIPIREPFWAPVTAGQRPPSSRPTVLFLGSAQGGLGRVNAACRRILMAATPARLVVVAGSDRVLWNRLTALSRRVGSDRLQVHGLVRSIAPLLQEADILITKAGGLSLSEALAVGVPMVIYRPIPGHEVDNAEWLRREGAAVLTRRPDEVARAVRSLLDRPGWRHHLATRAKSLGRPHAARDVVRVARRLLPD